MVAVFFNWTYIAATAFLVGFALCRSVCRITGYDVNDIGSILAVGLMAVTVYAQIFSLFYKVGTAANVILAAACVLSAVLWHRQIKSLMAAVWGGKSVAWKAVMAAGIVAWCFCTSRGYMHYDSDLYHAQSIRWIEEYGVVRGLGNIHVRFAYNSSFFALSALYGMKPLVDFLGGRPLHAVNGFFALLLWTQVLPIFRRKTGERTSVTDFARVGAFYYLTLIYSDIVSPASDYAIMCVVFFIVIKWLELLGDGVDEAAPYALLCVAGVYAVTLKLTAGLLLLLVLKPLVMLVREKKWRDIGFYLIMGMAVAAPWMARTVVISGYLLYPYPALDIFSVDWKVDAAEAALDSAEIVAWGRALENAALAGLPVGRWFGGWFGRLPSAGKLFILADIVCIPVSVFLAFGQMLARRGADRLTRGQLFVLLSVMSSYGFWQLSAPLLRYGYAYVLLVIMITLGILCDIFIKCFDKTEKKDIINRKAAIFGAAMLAVFSAVKLASLIRHISAESEQPAYVCQQDYGHYDLESYDVNGVTFYYPSSGDRTGYDSFPSLPRRTRIVFRGETIKEGFTH